MLHDFSNSLVAISVEPLPELIETAIRTPKGTIVVPSRCCSTEVKLTYVNGTTIHPTKSA